MTDSTPPTPARLFRGLTIPQSIVIVGLLALGGWIAYLLPPDTLNRAVIALLVALGVGGTALSGPTDASAPSVPPPPSAPRDRRGYAHLDALLWLAAVGALAWAWAQRAGLLSVLMLAIVLPGCGAGALQVQARAATVATVALEGAHRLTMDETERRLEACLDVACIQDVERTMAPIALAYEAARVSLVGWVEALQVAQVAGDDGDVIGALLTAAGRWLALWDPLAAALAGVGVDVPLLPPLVTGLLGGAQ